MLLHHLRSRLRPTCWLAIFAMLMLVFGPTLTHGASVPRADAYGADLCSMTGTTMAGMTPGGAPDDGAPNPAGAQHDGHCATCTQPGSALGMPVAVGVALPLRLASAPAPAEASDAPRRSHAWLGAPPRGPPAA